MSLAPVIDTTQAVSAVTLAALAGVVFFVFLVFAGRPQAYASRLAQLSATSAKLEALARSQPSPVSFPVKAVCNGPTATAADALRRTLTSTAGSTNVAITSVVVTPGLADESAGGLAPVTLRFEATGQYPAVLDLLGQMGRWQPELFIDSLDLRSQVSSVGLKLEGRIYCLTSARL